VGRAPWFEEAVLSFRPKTVAMAGAATQYYDKAPSSSALLAEDFAAGVFAVHRDGEARAYIAKNAVLMPSYVNIGRRR